MRQKILKAFCILTMLIAMVFVYASAIKWKSNNPNNLATVESHKKVDNDSLNVGVPTGDDPWNELNRIVDSYYGSSGITYEGTLKLIDGNEEEDKVLEEQKFTYTLFNGDYHYSIGGMEVISRRRYLVTVDHNNRLIALSPKGAGNHKNEMFDISAFKKIIEARKGEAKVTQLGSEKILTIDNIEDPSIQGYRIYYSPGTYQVHKMLLGMARLSSLTEETEENVVQDSNGVKPAQENANNDSTSTNAIEGFYYYLEIAYSNIKALALKKNAFHPEDQFIQWGKNKIEVKEAYKDYQLLNTIEP